jgi:Purple acid Phosphatase, N-terminal domain
VPKAITIVVAALALFAFIAVPAAVADETSAGLWPSDHQATGSGAATALAAIPAADAAPGGPILVVTATGNKFTRYLAEILQAEGLNAYATADVSALDATLLADYKVVVLGETALTAGQVTDLANWVDAGGNLIAMRPDAQLFGLLGVTSSGFNRANQYLKLTASPAAAGIVTDSIQYHGTATRYTLAGATAVATLYTTPTNPTPNPAVTLRSVGSAGGEAAAFAFDLARSVVYTRQGRPGWAKQERDGVPPIRPDDLFYGAKAGNPQPDWVDLNKVAIPQADEQQRLLANLITRMARDVMPIPRFWYFPRDEKAVIIMTGDDHASGGTAGRFDSQAAQSPPGCSVADWECIRSTSYIYTGTPLSNAQATAYDAQGFEVALHFDTNCANWTPAQLENFFATQLAAWQAKYTSVPSPVSNRTHCITWSDWASHPKTELTHGIRFDTNYYYWPPDWIQNRPGMFTGSGMPMRFADLDGTVIDVFQGATQMTDESGQTYPFTADALLDRAIGPEGYYGAFVANMHTDSASSAGATAIISSALARGVPVVSSRQMLTWLDGRNASSFGSLAYSGDTMSFTIAPGAGANGLRALLPASTPDGSITGLTLGGLPVPFTVEVVKGIEYARFDAAAGSYEATYIADTDGPVITDVDADPDSDGTAVVTWSTDEPSSSRVDYGTSAGSLTSSATSPGLTTSHSVTLTGLAASTTYHYRVTSTDASANSTTEPTGTPFTFTTESATLVDTSAADFGAGTLGAGTYLAQAGDGEVVLSPLVGSEFSGSSLPAGWTSVPWNAGGSSTVANGFVTVDGSLLATDSFFGPGRALEFSAAIDGEAFQHAGLGTDLNDFPWALVSSFNGNSGLWARTNNGTATNTSISASTGQMHRYRIEWTASGLAYYADGALVATHLTPIGTNLRPVVSDIFVNTSTVRVDWLRLSPYASAGTFTSRVLGDGTERTWGNLSADVGAPAGTSVALSVRTGDTPTPDGTWTGWQALPGTGGSVGTTSAYLQYSADLATTDDSATPELRSVEVEYQLTGPPLPTVLFSDDFESGNLGAWTTVHGLTVTAEAAFAGAFGARANAPGAAAVWARKTLASPAHDVTTTVRFKVDSRTTRMHLLRLLSSGNASLVTVSLNNTGRLLYRNAVAGVAHTSTITPTNGVWHELSVRTFADGATGHVTVKLDGVTVPGLDLVENIGTDPIGRVTLGDDNTADVYSAAYDDLVVAG